MTQEKIIKEGRPFEPNCFETDNEELWYQIGLYDGATASPWISVKDKLPDTGEEVLVSYECAFLDISCRHSKDSGIPYLDTNGFVTERNGGKYTGDIVHVDYWMPIPEVPKEGEK